MTDRPASVDDYIQSFPSDVRSMLGEIRQAIRRVVPDGEEAISYQIPSIRWHGKYLVYFAGWKEHVSVYPLPRSAEFAERVAPHRSGKGTARFPIDQPLPTGLIENLVELLIEEREGMEAGQG